MTGADDDASLYGRSFADVYDDWYASAFDTDEAVAALLRLSAGGSLLELGAGTGRLAIPLAAADVDVVALDSSAAMLERLHDRDPDRRVTTVQSDMAAMADDPLLAPRRFDVIACACSSILNLPDEDAIRRCLTSAAHLLAPDGVLVVEAIVPADRGTIPLRSLTPARVDSDAAVFVETDFDVTTGRLRGRHVEVVDGAVRTRPWAVVLCGPERFDAIADEAGLVLAERWSDWSGSTYDDDATSHVSIWRRRP